MKINKMIRISDGYKIVLENGETLKVKNVEQPWKPGFNLSPTELAGLQRQDQIAKALKRIYYLLSLKDYTLGELQTKLKQKSFTSDIINESLQLIQSQGLIDEKNIAQGILDKYTACKPEGWRRIKARLNTKGIDKEIVSEIVDQAKQRNEFDLAWKIGKKKRGLCPLSAGKPSSVLLGRTTILEYPR